MASKKKEGRIIITLECTEARAAGMSPSRYTTMKNRHNDPERMELKKYNPFMKKHTLHKEVK
ncbi:MAG: 50S ribosomal protein L33 [bacterium]|nr:50S ribosomal protein L33 [bacterium]